MKKILISIFSAMLLGCISLFAQTTPDKDYLCFTAEVAGATVQLKKTSTPAAVSLEYTTNGSAWTDFVIGTTEGCGVTLANVGDKVYLRNKLEAKDVTTFSESNSKYYCFTFSDSVSVSGNVMSLVDKNVGTTTIPCDYCFCRLFYNSTSLTSVADLKLPATMLTTCCYQQMFNGCKSLKTAGVLPATTLAEKCCYQMFYGCTALETAPALPADTLARQCYDNMFNGCIKLTTAPELPADTLAERCYYGMFNGCAALETAPALPATTLAKHCYSCMFYGCESLETAPELPATTLAEYCYNSMFYRCKSLETAPELPAETLVQNCYSQMFYDCKKLNFVKVGFKAWADNVNATNNWLKNAGTEATTPTFECPAELDVTTRDDYHVPAGWTVKRAAVEVTIDDATPYHAEKDTENATVTYTRTFAAEGQYEALYLPFSVTMTEDLMEKVTIAKIYMVSTKGSVVGGSQDAGVNVVVVKTLGEGESTMPHTPYFIRSEAGTDLEFTQEGTTLYASTTAYPGHIDCSTTMDTYDFIGTYEGKSLTPEAGKFIYMLQNGALHKVTTETTLACNRWQMDKTPRSWTEMPAGIDAQEKMQIVTLGEDDTTGIVGLDANADSNLNEGVYNLQGQRMHNVVNGFRGVVISNGKKYIMR